MPDGDNHAFAHKMTRLVLVVKAGDLMSFDEVKAAAITLGGLKHEGTFNAYTGVAAASGEAVADWSLANAMKAEGADALTFTAILLPQALASTLAFKATIAGDCCGNIYGCHVTGTLKGNNMVGGLTGLYAPANYAALYACSAQCDVSGYSSVGGLMGYAQQGAALACWADCVMTSTDDPDDFECGYLAGSMGSDFVFSACYWTGTGVDNPVGWTRLADGSYAYPTAGTTKVDGTSRTWANATSDMNRELATNTNVSSDFTYRWYQATGSESNPPVLKK